MFRRPSSSHRFPTFSVLLVVITSVFSIGSSANAQCLHDVLTFGLQGPSKILQTNIRDLIVAETGTPAPNSGRVSIVGLNGSRRSLLEGLPSGQNSIGDFSGTQGVFMSGRTLYVLNGEGNATVPGPFPGSELPNPHPNSPIMSSVLAVTFSAAAEKFTSGFVLTLADHQALKNGQKLEFSNGGEDKISVELIVDFPDYVSEGPFVRHSNPFGVTGIGNQLFVSDGGRNLIFKVDVSSRTFSVLTEFAPIPNPFFPPAPPPVIEAVPAGVRVHNGQLLVALFRGFPFIPGNSDIVRVDPNTGATVQYINGLSSAIDVLPVTKEGTTQYLVLEISTNFLANTAGRLQRFATTAGPRTVISNCLVGPTNMVRDDKTGILYITSIFTGQIYKIPGQ